MAIVYRGYTADGSGDVAQELLGDVNLCANFCVNGCDGAPEVVQSEGINLFEFGVNPGF